MRILLPLFITLTAVAQEPFSQRFFEVKQYSQEDNQAIVKKFHGLRVTDGRRRPRHGGHSRRYGDGSANRTPMAR